MTQYLREEAPGPFHQDRKPLVVVSHISDPVSTDPPWSHVDLFESPIPNSFLQFSSSMCFTADFVSMQSLHCSCMRPKGRLWCQLHRHSVSFRNLKECFNWTVEFWALVYNFLLSPPFWVLVSPWYFTLQLFWFRPLWIRFFFRILISCSRVSLSYLVVWCGC